MSVKVIEEAQEIPQLIANYAPVAYICNINKEDVPMVFSTYHAPYQLAVPGENEEYAVTQIVWVKHLKDRGDYNPFKPDTREEVIIGAREIANDICRRLNQNMVLSEAGESFWGYFVIAGPEPTPEELAAGHKRLNAVMADLISLGDSEWDTYHSHKQIPKTCRVAAKYLGLSIHDHPWVSDIRTTPDCPACGEKLPKADVAICSKCGAIINEEKARKFGLLDETPEAVSSAPRPRGRPRTRQQV